jgi:hypothetical protein
MNSRVKIEVQAEGKEYPDMTLDQLKVMVKYLNAGLTEEEAKKKALEEIE